MQLKYEITIPEKVAKVLGLKDSEAGSYLKKELAVYFFQRNLLSFGQARQLAELSVHDFLELLRERKVPLHYDIIEYEEDSRTIQEIL